jgi:hypothetical protein
VIISKPRSKIVSKGWNLARSFFRPKTPSVSLLSNKENQTMSQPIRPCLLIITAFICGIIFSLPQTAFAQSCAVCISEFRVNGPAGGNDEFVELYNGGSSAVNITGWKINGSNNAASTGLRATIGTVTLQPGQHYLLTGSAYSLASVAAGDFTTLSGTTEDGGLALLNASNVIQDQVGLSSGSAYKEGTPLASMTNGSGTAPAATNQFSYVRRVNLTTNQPW